jgi:hypothetical protein
LGTNARHVAVIAGEPEQTLVQRLYNVKGSHSHRLGAELASEWPNRNAIPVALQRLFQASDALL